MPQHLPGHNFLGPGTQDLVKPVPVDEDDRIAQEHDLAYQFAHSDTDVRQADVHAINQFLSDSWRNPHSLLGAAGLGAKYVVESAAGVQYGKTVAPATPRPILQAGRPHEKVHVPGAKQAKTQPASSLGKRGGPSESNEAEAAPAKTSHISQTADSGSSSHVSSTTNDSDQIEAPSQSVSSVPSSIGSSGSAMSSMPEPQAGGSIPGGTGSSQMPVEITQNQQPTVNLEFSKTFQIYTAGFQFTNKSNSSYYKGPDNFPWTGIVNDGYTGVYTTPLCAINPGMTQLYLTKAEWESLPRGAYATHCCIKVTPLGYRLPFTTNEATSTFANSQTLVQIATNIGINTVMNCMINQYQVTAPDLTTPTGQFSSDDVEQTLYGYQGMIGCNMGIPRHFNRYLVLLSPRPNNVNGALEPSPNLMNHIKVMNVNDVKGTPVINFEHSFKNGLLKFPLTCQAAFINDNAEIIEGNNPNGWWTRVMQAQGVAGARRLQMYGEQTERNPTGTTNNTILTDYRADIEKADTCSRNYNRRFTPDRAPLVCFGVFPVQSNPALSNAPTFADVVVQWQLSTCLYISYQLNYMHPTVDIYYLKSWDPQVGVIDYTAAEFHGDNPFALLMNRKWYPNRVAYFADELILKSAGAPTVAKVESKEAAEAKNRRRVELRQIDDPDFEMVSPPAAGGITIVDKPDPVKPPGAMGKYRAMFQ